MLLPSVGNAVSNWESRLAAAVFPARSTVYDIDLPVLGGTYLVLKVLLDLSGGAVPGQIVDIHSACTICVVVHLPCVSTLPFAGCTRVICFRVHIQGRNIDQRPARNSIEVDCHRSPFDREWISVSRSGSHPIR